MLKEWKTNDHLTVVKNASYWRKDSKGVQLPYLDSIIFKPIIESQQMVNSVQSSNIDLALDDTARDIKQYRDFASAKSIKLSESDKFPEISYTMLNSTRLPFSKSTRAERSLRRRPRQARPGALSQRPGTASGPFGPGVKGYLKTRAYELRPGEGQGLRCQVHAGDGQAADAHLRVSCHRYQHAPGPRLHQELPGASRYEGQRAGARRVGRYQPPRSASSSTPSAGATTPATTRTPSYVGGTVATRPAIATNIVNFSGFNDPKMNKDFDDARATSDEPSAPRCTRTSTGVRQEPVRGLGLLHDLGDSSPEEREWCRNAAVVERRQAVPRLHQRDRSGGIWKT